MRAGAAAAADVAPDPPTNLTSSVFFGAAGAQVSLFWRAPASGPAPTNYRIEAGSAAGLSDLAAFNTASNSTFFPTTVSGAGTFYVRVRAVAAGGTSVASNEIILVLLDPGLPRPPFLFSPAVNGSTVTLSWFSFSGAPVTSWVIQASSTAGGPPDLANFATGNSLTTLTATGVRPGTYFVRVLGANNAGIGPPSSEVSFIVLGVPAGCTAAPNQPSNLVAIVSGSTVTLGWSPSSGSASYVVEAGSGVGRADLATADTGSTAGTATFNGVGIGTYYVRVRGKNACGLSAVSNEVLVAVR